MLIDGNINILALQNLINEYEPKFIFFNKMKKKTLKGYSSIFEFYNYILVKPCIDFPTFCPTLGIGDPDSPATDLVLVTGQFSIKTIIFITIF